MKCFSFKRNYDIAEISSLPSALSNLISLFGSEPMFTILGSLTGLTSENDEDEEQGESSYEPSAKKQKAEAKTVSTASTSNNSSSATARWHFELRRWKPTYYSLSFDTENDEENPEKNGALDVMMFFNYPSSGLFF